MSLADAIRAAAQEKNAQESPAAKSPSQKTRKPESQKTPSRTPLARVSAPSKSDDQPAAASHKGRGGEQANLSIKIGKDYRLHWLIEAKRQNTSLTEAIVEALTARFGLPPEA